MDTFQHDIVIQTRSGKLEHISSLNPAYMALQYPLLFWYGEHGYPVGVPYIGVDTVGVPCDGVDTVGVPCDSVGIGEKKLRVKITMQDHFRYRFHYQKNEANPFLCYDALSSQAKVDARACIDENRLWYVIKNQAKLRVDSYQGIVNAMRRECVDDTD